MAYFVFNKNCENIEGSLVRFAENQSDLNNLNIDQSSYRIINNNEIDFNEIKNQKKIVLSYTNNDINFKDHSLLFKEEKDLKAYIELLKKQIKLFLDNNPNHTLFNRWNNYYNQLNSLETSSLSYPLDKSLEQYFNDLNQPSFNILQIP